MRILFVQWNSAAINNDKPVNNAWITNNTGATNINANSIGSVTPTINAEMELAINQPYTCFSEQIGGVIHRQRRGGIPNIIIGKNPA